MGVIVCSLNNLLIVFFLNTKFQNGIDSITVNRISPFEATATCKDTVAQPVPHKTIVILNTAGRDIQRLQIWEPQIKWTVSNTGTSHCQQDHMMTLCRCRITSAAGSCDNFVFNFKLKDKTQKPNTENLEFRTTETII